MTENTVIKDVILEKKLDGYGSNNNDFVAHGEITVTITLSEYRNLLIECARADSKIKEANNDKYTRDKENEKLKAQVQALKEKLYSLTIESDKVSEGAINNSNVEE